MIQLELKIENSKNWYVSDSTQGIQSYFANEVNTVVGPHIAVNLNQLELFFYRHQYLFKSLELNLKVNGQFKHTVFQIRGFKI